MTDSASPALSSSKRSSVSTDVRRTLVDESVGTDKAWACTNRTTAAEYLGDGVASSIGEETAMKGDNLSYRLPEK